MSGAYFKYPVSGGGVPIYSTISVFPASATQGSLGVAQNTGILYEWNGSAWVAIGGPGTVFSVGTIDSQTASANGAVIASNALVLQSASATRPGLVNNTTQSLSGNKTFTGTIAASNFSGSSSGTNTGDVTIGTADGLSLSGQVLSLALATISTPGAVLNVGGANGVAPLDASSKIPVAYLPSVVMEYQGAWDPTTNTPTLSDGTGTNGYVYYVTALRLAAVSGLTDPSMVNFQIGDLTIYSSAVGKWQLVTPAAGVSSVNGAQGAVTVNAINQLTGDVTAGPASGSASAASSLVATSNSTLATLSGLTTASSLASIGTITSGIWHGTAIGAQYGGTGLNTSASTGVPSISGGTWSVNTQLPVTLGGTGLGTLTLNNVILGNGTSNPQFVAPGTNGNVLTSNGTTWTSAGGTLNNPMTTLGDIIYEDATPTPTRLAGNTTTTKKFLTQTGNGSISAVPGWNILVSGDVPAVNLAAGGNGGITGALGIGNGGTGATSKAAAFDALSPMTAFGDMIYGSSSGSASRVPGNTTTTTKYLQSIGSAGAATQPVWTAFTAPTIQKFTSGSGTYTTPTSPPPLYIRVLMVGGGGGGGGSGTASETSGGTGGNTTFGSSLLAANGGGGGVAALSGAAGGAGGTASLGSGPIGTAVSGGYGSGSSNSAQSAGGSGAGSALGGGGGGGASIAAAAQAGSPGSTNTGGGGGGASIGAGAAPPGGGGSGGYVNALISAPSATYAYAVGAAGTAGGAGTAGAAGGAGGSGYIEVTEYYQ